MIRKSASQFSEANMLNKKSPSSLKAPI